MTRKAVIKVALILVFFGVIMITSFASSDNNQEMSRLGPPIEAIEVCEGRAAGEGVEFVGPQGEIIPANCREIKGQLTAFPEEMPPGRPPQPKQHFQ